MKNKDVFENYGSEHWVIRENLCYLLQLYWEKHGNTVTMPENPVAFVKQFLEDETLCNIEFAEKSKLNTLENNVVIEI